MRQHVGFAVGGQGELAESRCKALENFYCFGLEESSRKWSYLGQLRKRKIKYFFLKKKKIFSQKKKMKSFFIGLTKEK